MRVPIKHLFVISFAIAGAGPVDAQSANHLVPCDDSFENYYARVEELMRLSSKDQFELLVTITDLRPERGVGIVRDGDEFKAVRLEFDRSFWASSWVESEANNYVLDFSRGRASVRSKTAVLPAEVGREVLRALETEIRVARPIEQTPDQSAEIVLDGPTIRFSLGAERCAQTYAPRADSRAGKSVAVALAAASYVGCKKRDRGLAVKELRGAIESLAIAQ